MGAMDQGQLHAVLAWRSFDGLCRQASPQVLGDEIGHRAVLFDSAKLHRFHQFVWEIECCFHAPRLPEIWVSGNCFCR